MLIEKMKRYSLTQKEDPDCDCQMYEYPYGEYVKFLDIKDKNPSTDVKELKKEISDLCDQVSAWNRDDETPYLHSIWAQLLRLSQDI